MLKKQTSSQLSSAHSSSPESQSMAVEFRAPSSAPKAKNTKNGELRFPRSWNLIFFCYYLSKRQNGFCFPKWRGPTHSGMLTFGLFRLLSSFSFLPKRNPGLDEGCWWEMEGGDASSSIRLFHPAVSFLLTPSSTWLRSFVSHHFSGNITKSELTISSHLFISNPKGKT